MKKIGYIITLLQFSLPVISAPTITQHWEPNPVIVGNPKIYTRVITGAVSCSSGGTTWQTTAHETLEWVSPIRTTPGTYDTSIKCVGSGGNETKHIITNVVQDPEGA